MAACGRRSSSSSLRERSSSSSALPRRRSSTASPARTLLALTWLVAAAAAVAWVVFALDPTRGLAVAAGGLTVCAALQLGTLALSRLVARTKDVDRQIAEAEARLDSLVTQETESHAAEIERTLARARADSLSRLVGEERRIAEERRTALADRERTASAELSDALAQGRAARRPPARRVDRRPRAHRAKPRGAGNVARTAPAGADGRGGIADRARHPEPRHGQRGSAGARSAPSRRNSSEPHARTPRARTSELESHERDRRRALHEVADRLRQRERELSERVAAEEAEAIQRIQAGFADVERRQVDQLKRVVERTASTFSEAVAQQFDAAIKSAREDAAQRLSRELDRAVAHFSKEAQSVLAERLAHVADAGGQRLERKLSQIGNDARARAGRARRGARSGESAPPRPISARRCSRSPLTPRRSERVLHATPPGPPAKDRRSVERRRLAALADVPRKLSEATANFRAKGSSRKWRTTPDADDTGRRDTPG